MIPESTKVFKGFRPAREIYFKVPNELIDVLPLIETVAELKVVLAVLKETYTAPTFPVRVEYICEVSGLSINDTHAGIVLALAHGFLKETQRGWYVANTGEGSE